MAVSTPIPGKTTSGGEDSETCGDAVKVFLDCGYATLICTLPVHDDNKHYDEVFYRGWSRYGESPD